MTRAVTWFMPAAGLAAQNCNNQDIPLRITIIGFEGSALSGDSKGPTYQEGLDGVYNAVIHFCSGTHDATLGMIAGTKRTMGFTFPAAITGSNIDGPSPVWANNVTFQTKPSFGIQNILWGRDHARTTPSTFTTRMGIGNILGPGSKATYRLQFRPMLTDAFVGSSGFAAPNVNLPNETSYVTVEDFPGTCRTDPNGTLDKWMVTATNPSSTFPGSVQVGTLFKDVRGLLVHSGQYTMPFQLLIEALKCLPY